MEAVAQVAAVTRGKTILWRHNSHAGQTIRARISKFHGFRWHAGPHSCWWVSGSMCQGIARHKTRSTEIVVQRELTP
jgi:hypothetical protein